MPKVRGVYRDAKGGWYFKAASHKDPVAGKWKQVTRRGFATATEAGRARQAFLDEQETMPPSAIAGLTVTELVTRYLDDCEATERLGPKSLFDYRHYLDDYITPWIGSRLVREVDAEMIAVGRSISRPKVAGRRAPGCLRTRSAWPARR